MNDDNIRENMYRMYCNWYDRTGGSAEDFKRIVEEDPRFFADAVGYDYNNQSALSVRVTDDVIAVHGNDIGPAWIEWPAFDENGMTPQQIGMIASAPGSRGSDNDLAFLRLVGFVIVALVTISLITAFPAIAAGLVGIAGCCGIGWAAFKAAG